MLTSVVGVVIVVGGRLYRDSLAAAFEKAERIQVLGTAADWSQAFGHLQRQHPDVALVDAALVTGGRGAQLLAQTAPWVRLVALAVPDDEAAVLRCLEAGVAGYVRSDASLSELTETVERAACGELLCSPRIAGALGRRLCDLAAERAPSTDVGCLTPREVEVLHLLEQNLSNREIAGRLYIEEATVKNHVHNVLAKLHIRSRTHAAAWVRGGDGS